jgi:hypothetical protein
MSVRLDTENPELYQELLNRYDTWMFDCDGVLWRGDRLIDCVAEVLRISTQSEYVTVSFAPLGVFALNHVPFAWTFLTHSI